MTTPRPYAQGTHVTVERSRDEVETLLARYGADQFAYGWEHDDRVVGFRMEDRMVRLRLQLPSATDRNVVVDSRGYRRTEIQQRAVREQLSREKWRALVLILKAKLESVASGITTLEAEFLSQTLLPDGRTVGEWVRPSVESAYATGKMPALLTSGQ